MVDRVFIWRRLMYTIGRQGALSNNERELIYQVDL